MQDRTTTLASGLVPRANTTRAWPITVNGHPLVEQIGGPVHTLSIDCVRDPANPDGTRLGRLQYGAEPAADGSASRYDTWIWHELGGAVTVPFAVIDGELHVGVIEQRRNTERHPEYNPTGLVMNVPRGFHDPRKREGDATAAAELVQEVGPFDGDIIRLDGANANCNNAWVSYEDECDKDGKPVRQGGVSFHAVKVNPEYLAKQPDDSYKIVDAVSAGRPQGSAYEVILRCVFISWHQAIRLRDAFTAVGTVRLMSYLDEMREADIYFHEAKDEQATEPVE